MLGIFRTNQLWNSFLFLFYALLARVYFFFAPVDMTRGGEAYFSNHLLATLPQGIIGNAIAIVCISLQAILVAWIVARHRLDREVTLFSGVFYILFASISWWFFPMSPVLIANFFFLFALNELFSTYRKKSCADLIFNAGFLIGIASLFYASYALMIFVGFLALANLRSVNIKETLMLLLGFSSIYLLTAVHQFWYDSLDEFIAYVVQSFRFGDVFQMAFEWDNLIVITSFTLLSLFAIFNINSYTLRKNINVQKNITILYQVLIFGILAIFIQKEIYWRIDHFLILAIPLSILISFNFVNMKNKATASSIHLFLLALVLLFHFKNLI